MNIPARTAAAVHPPGLSRAPNVLISPASAIRPPYQHVFDLKKSAIVHPCDAPRPNAAWPVLIRLAAWEPSPDASPLSTPPRAPNAAPMPAFRRLRVGFFSAVSAAVLAPSSVAAT